jgi:hypothetical protein
LSLPLHFAIFSWNIGHGDVIADCSGGIFYNRHGEFVKDCSATVFYGAIVSYIKDFLLFLLLSIKS